MTVQDMIKELIGVYPQFFNDETKAAGRAALYRRSLTHLSPEQLAAAFSDTMRYWNPEYPQPPMPADILRHVYAGGRLGDCSINMKAMSDALPALCVDIEKNWRARSVAWLDGLVQQFRDKNPGHEKAVEDEVRTRIGSLLRSSIHRYAQRVWAQRANIEDFRIFDDELDRYVGRPGVMDPYVVAIREGREPPRMSARQLLGKKGKAA
jgi:hypothetical protein